MRKTSSSLALASAVALALGAATAVRPAAAGAPPGWLTSVERAAAEARAGGRFILVDLYADWCVWCHRLERSVFSDPLFQEFARGFVLLRVDTEDGGEGTALMERYGVGSLPTTLVLDPRLVKAGQVTGFATTRAYIGFIEQQLEAYRAFEARYADLAGSGDPRVLGALADELLERVDGERAAELYARILSRSEGGSPGAAPLRPADAAWLRYRLADALRVAGDWDAARREAASARASADGLGDADLVERVDLLRFEIAEDSGACAQAIRALEAFLESHPRSRFGPYARRSLESLRAGASVRCS